MPKITLLKNETILKTQNKSANISEKSNKSATIRPICSNPGMRKGRIHIQNNKLKWSPYYSTRWGNVLSPMWQARAMAILGGYMYTSRRFGSGTWMEYLPNKYYNISGINITQFHIACNSCHGKRWEFAHECFNAWDFIHETIVTDTRKALSQWYHNNRQEIPEFHKYDWYLYDRCASDTILSHPYHGPLRFQAMRAIHENAENIYIVSDKKEQQKIDLCKAITEERIEYLQQYYPLANVEVIGSDATRDFMRLVFAKNVIITGHGSSFALWSIMANIGNVYLCKFKIEKGNHSERIIPKGLQQHSNFHFFNDKYGQVLFPDETNISKNQKDILKWLKYEDYIESENMFEK